MELEVILMVWQLDPKMASLSQRFYSYKRTRPVEKALAYNSLEDNYAKQI